MVSPLHKHFDFPRLACLIVLIFEKLIIFNK